MYVVDLPEYVARKGSKVAYGRSREEVTEKVGGGQCAVTHFKGLGEMDEVDLERTVTNRDTRRLTRLIPTDRKGKSNFEALMGKNVAYRKEVLGINAVDAGKQRKTP